MSRNALHLAAQAVIDAHEAGSPMADAVGALRNALEADRARLARCPVLTVSEATTADGATLTGDRDAQRRAADMLHQDVRLVPVR